ncbi:MAG: hypothetical protein ACQEVA_04080, partial [Myxococcota bacterium]
MTDTLSKSEFARRIMTGIEAAGADDRFAYDAESFEIHDQQTGASFGLNNAYIAYTGASESRRPAVLDHYLDSWLSPDPDVPEAFDLVREQLMPVVRPRWFFQKVELERDHQGREPLGVVFSPLAEHYSVALVADFPRKMSFILGKHLAQWEVEFADAIDPAMKNLARRSDRATADQIADGVWVLEFEGGYHTSRLIYDPLWDSLGLEDEPVVFLPDRDLMIYADRAAPRAVARAAFFCLEKQGEFARPQSTFAVTRDHGEWRLFDPSPNHPAKPFLNALHYQSRTKQYAEQEPLIEQVFRSTGENWFVPTYAPVEGGDDRWQSVTVWPADRAALLPRTDVIVFSGWNIGDGDAFDVRFSDCRRILTRAIQELDVYPPRFAAHPDVSPKQLEALYEARL